MEFLYLLEGIRNPVLDAIVSLVTKLGEETIVLAVMCILFWCANKNLAYKLGLVFFSSGLAVQTLKITFRIDRPWVLDPDFEPVAGSKTTATSYSFPSGHTQSSTSLFGALACHFKKWWVSIVCTVIFLAVGFSRMYLGVHTPKDVFTAMLISLGMAFIIEFLVMRLIPDTKKGNITVAIGLAVISVAVMTYSLILMGSGTSTAEYAADCSKAAAAGLGFALGWFIERTYIRFDTKTDKLWKQIVKLAIGVGGALGIKSGIKALFVAMGFVVDTPAFIPVDITRYFLMVVWVLILFPLIVKKFFTKKEEK